MSTTIGRFVTHPIPGVLNYLSLMVIVDVNKPVLEE